MRKALILTLVLAALSIGCLCAVSSWINTKKDAVTVTQTVLCGDPAVADGLEISNQSTLANHLFWDTIHTPGSAMSSHTTFRYLPTRPSYESAAMPVAQLHCDLGFTMSGNVDLNESNYSQPLRIARDVASRAPNGQTYTETVLLRDYYATLPLSLDIWGDGMSYWLTGQDAQRLCDYLQIPTPDGAQITTTVTKTTGGQIEYLESTPEPGNLFSATSLPLLVLREDLLLLGITSRPSAWEDSPPIPENRSGLHLLPLVPHHEATAYTAQNRLGIEQMELVYPLSVESTLHTLLESADKTRVLLLVEENHAFSLHVLDRQTLQPLQIVPLRTAQAGETVMQAKQWGDFLSIFWSDGSFCILPELPGQPYAPAISASLADSPNPPDGYQPDTMSLAYDGTRLAIVYYSTAYTNFSDTQLLVFTRDGLAFAADYTLGLSGQNPSIMPVYQDPLRIAFQ